MIAYSRLYGTLCRVSDEQFRVIRETQGILAEIGKDEAKKLGLIHLWHVFFDFVPIDTPESELTFGDLAKAIYGDERKPRYFVGLHRNPNPTVGVAALPDNRVYSQRIQYVPNDGERSFFHGYSFFDEADEIRFGISEKSIRGTTMHAYVKGGLLYFHGEHDLSENGKPFRKEGLEALRKYIAEKR